MSRLNDFNPLSPCGERPQSQPPAKYCTYFNPLSPCGERHGSRWGWKYPKKISIHSPHAGRDTYRPVLPRHRPMISIHSPHAGRDGLTLTYSIRPTNFNPLSPCGERPDPPYLLETRSDFNPLSPCGERLMAVRNYLDITWISIHSPHAGRDPLDPEATVTIDLFQSTLPMRGETGLTLY